MAARNKRANPYKRVGKDLNDFFVRSGGWGSLLSSPYVHVSVILTILCYGSWRNGGWSDIPISVLPALLGFTLAAYALLLAFGDESFRAFLAVPSKSVGETPEPAENLLLSASSIFLLFIIVQSVALAFAIIAHAHTLGTFFPNGHPWYVTVARNLFAFAGYFTFIFSIAMAVAAGLNIYHVTCWYVQFKEATAPNE